MDNTNIGFHSTEHQLGYRTSCKKTEGASSSCNIDTKGKLGLNRHPWHGFTCSWLAGNKDGDLRGEWTLVRHLNYWKRCRLQRQYDGVEVYSMLVMEWLGTWKLELIFRPDWSSCNIRPEPLRGTGSCFYWKDEHLQVGHMWDSDLKASFTDMNPWSSHYRKGCFEGDQIMKGRLHGLFGKENWRLFSGVIHECSSQQESNESNIRWGLCA